MTIEGPIRVLIVDDEPLARNKLQLLLGRDPEIEIAGAAENAQRAIELIAMLRPDVLFLDVQMPDGDGFEVLNQIPPEMMPAVIFTTAFDMYAIRAFEAQAVDYLLKPFDEERFAKVLMRAKSHLARTIAARTESGTEAPSAAATAERFVIKTGGRIIFLNSTDIDWFQAEADSSACTRAALPTRFEAPSAPPNRNSIANPSCAFTARSSSTSSASAKFARATAENLSSRSATAKKSPRAATTATT